MEGQCTIKQQDGESKERIGDVRGAEVDGCDGGVGEGKFSFKNQNFVK